MAIVMVITSGKDGDGKTNIAANLGLALSERQSRVCIIDADTGQSNINNLLGVTSEFTLEHVLHGDKTIIDITIDHPSGISIVPEACGLAICNKLSQQHKQHLTDALIHLENAYDYIIIDTTSGAHDNKLNYIASAQYRIIVITPDPTSIQNAFALLKLLATNQLASSIYILVNRVKDYQSSLKIYVRFQAAVKKQLNIDILYLGYLVQDHNMLKAVTAQNPVVSIFPETPVSCCFYALADVVKNRMTDHQKAHFFSQFWQSPAIKKPQGPRKQPNFAYYQKSAQQLISCIEHTEISSHQAIQLIKPVLAAYLRKIHKTSETLYPAIYHFLAKQGYPETEIKDLVFTLESIFEQTYGKPLRNSNHMIAKIIAAIQGSEKKMKLLLKTLEKSYARQFQKTLYDPVKNTVELINKEEFTEQQFAAMMLQFKQAYQQRFHSEYKGNNDILVAKIKALLADDN